jgi:ATP-dependent Clp protease ATP-binding subunit ClpX
MSRKNVKLPIYKCSFCGRTAEEVESLISGPEVHICNDCVLSAVDIIEKHRKDAKSPFEHTLVPPTEIKEELDKYVIGQERAKRVLSVAVYNHYKRTNQKKSTDDVEIEKSNILMIGPTGTGKTLLAQTLARILNVPFTIADATVLTEAGYVGEDVENILVRLYQASNYNLEQTQRGIIYLDEIDKITRKSGNPSITRDVSGEGVQQAILKILEGTVSSIPPKGGRKHPEQNLINIDTSNILFICGGAFEGLEDVIRRRVGEKNIGFEQDVVSGHKYTKSELYSQVQTEDLIQYGLIPEMVGRLPVLSALSELEENDLYRVLTEPKSALIKQYKKLVGLENVELNFEEDAMKEIVLLALKTKTGARSLRSILEDKMLDIMYNIPTIPNLKSVTITKDVIINKAEPLYEFGTAEQSA